jgi:hypothetical protein
LQANSPLPIEFACHDGYEAILTAVRNHSSTPCLGEITVHDEQPNSLDLDAEVDRIERIGDLSEWLWSIVCTASKAAWDDYPDRFGMAPPAQTVANALLQIRVQDDPNFQRDVLDAAIGHGEGAIQRIEAELAEAQAALSVLERPTADLFRSLIALAAK